MHISKDHSQHLVNEFQVTFGHPVALTPTVLGPERGLPRTVWTGEELVEFLAASVKNKEDFSRLYYGFLEGLQKAFMKSLNADSYPQTEAEMLVAQADALGDINYFVKGTAEEMGINLAAVTMIIHESNMSKLFTDENGKKYVKYDETNGNKVMKSPEFFAPEENLRQYLLEGANPVGKPYRPMGKRIATLIGPNDNKVEIPFEDLKKGDRFSLKQDDKLVELANGQSVFTAAGDPYISEYAGDDPNQPVYQIKIEEIRIDPTATIEREVGGAE